MQSCHRRLVGRATTNRARLGDTPGRGRGRVFSISGSPAFAEFGPLDVLILCSLLEVIDDATADAIAARTAPSFGPRD